MKNIKRLIVIALATTMLLGATLTVHADQRYMCPVGGCGTVNGDAVSNGPTICNRGYTNCSALTYRYTCRKCGAVYNYCDKGHLQ